MPVLIFALVLSAQQLAKAKTLYTTTLANMIDETQAYPALGPWRIKIADDIVKLQNENPLDSVFQDDFNKLGDDIQEMKYQKWLYDKCNWM